MKKLRQHLKAARKAANKGFTLIELAIIGLFLGLLAVFAVSQFSSSAADTTRVTGLQEVAQKVADNWALLAQSCGVSSDVTALNLVTNNATGAAAGNLSLLLGNSTPHATYTNCFNQSGVRPMSNMAKGSAGSETIYDYPITLGSTTVGGRPAMLVNFANVPENVALIAYNRFSSASGAATATSLPASDTSDTSLRLSTASAGKRTVTFVRVL
jgi:Tfp pilus assembly protein PilE